MINAKKQNIIVVFLFCILVLIAVAPILFLDYNNAQLINTYHSTALPSDSDSSESVILQEYDAFERIQIAKKSAVEKTDVIVDWQENSISEEKQAELVNTVEQQLSILQELKTLPQLTLTGHYTPTIFKRTYMDMQNPNAPVNVWRIQIYYMDFFVDVYIDIDTSILYDVSIMSQTNNLVYDKNKMSANGFLKYLQNASNGIEKNGELFDANGIYNDNAIRLFATSYNDSTQTYTSYNFEDNQTYKVVNRAEDSTSDYYEVKDKIVP